MIQVSVVIPTFNRGEVLERAVESILLQKDVAFELILVDDGSTDGTSENYKNHGKLTLLKQENSGVSAARNLGIQNAQGEWVAFLDSDDEWLPGKLKAQLDFFEANPEYKICQTEEIWIRSGVRVNAMNKHKKYGGEIFEHCLPLCAISPSSVMIHKSIFEDVGVFDESFPACEDYELWLRIASNYKVGLIEENYLKKYGGHEDQLSRKYTAMDKFRIRALAKVLQSGQLSADQSSKALKTLQEKYAIFSAGAKKHGNMAELEALTALISPWLQA